MGFVDFPRRNLRSRNDFSLAINTAMGFVLKIPFTGPLSGHGSVRIGGRVISLIRWAGLRFLVVALVLFFFQPGFQFLNPLTKCIFSASLFTLMTELFGGIGLDKAGIHKYFGTIHQSRLNALPDDPFQKSAEKPPRPSDYVLYLKRYGLESHCPGHSLKTTANLTSSARYSSVPVRIEHCIKLKATSS